MYNYIIKNGFVVDGSGYPGMKQDIAIKNGKIACIASDINTEAQQVIDATGLIVAPGFIDAHSHSDRSLPYNRKAESSIRQGITTVMAGQCGSSVAPVNDNVKKLMKKEGQDIPWQSVGDYLNYLDKIGISINLGLFLGQGTVRAYVKAFEAGEASEEELEAMKALVHQAMEEGAFGLSSGRRYFPGSLASEKELIELSKVASDYSGMYNSHIYNQDAQILSSIKDLIEVGRQAYLPVQLVHQKICGKINWGNASKTLALMEDARREGIDILSDIYPYWYTQITNMDSLFPEWALEGTIEVVLKRLQEPENKQKVIAHMQDFANNNAVRFGSILQKGVLWCKNTKEVENLCFAEVAKAWDMDPCEMFVSLYVRNEGAVRTAGIMGEEDIQEIIAHPYSMIGTDSFCLDGVPEDQSELHPRNYGTYPYVLQHYVREKPLLTLEQAVHKMTGMPARRYGLRDRGLIRDNYAADIVLFDLNTVADLATITEPCNFPVGIEYVWVNGKLTWEQGNYHEVYAGKALRYHK